MSNIVSCEGLVCSILESGLNNLDVRKEAVGIAALVLIVLPQAAGGFWVVKSLIDGPTESKAEAVETGEEDVANYSVRDHSIKLVEEHEKALPDSSDFFMKDEKEEMALEEEDEDQDDEIVENDDGYGEDFGTEKDDSHVYNQSWNVSNSNDNSAKSDTSGNSSNESEKNVVENKSDDELKEEVKDEGKEKTPVDEDSSGSSSKDEGTGKDETTNPPKKEEENGNTGEVEPPGDGSTGDVVEIPKEGTEEGNTQKQPEGGKGETDVAS